VIRARPRRRAAALPARIDVHVHFDHDVARVVEVLEHLAGRFDRVEQQVGVLRTQGVQIMADINDVNTNMDTLATNLAELAREVKVLVDAGAGAVTQAQLDTLNERVKGLADLAKAADPNPDTNG